MYFYITPFNFSMYKLWIFIALVAAVIYIYKNLKYNEVSRKIILLSLFLSLVAIEVGGKLFTLITNENVKTYKDAGISSYGSVIALLLMMIIFTKIYKRNSKTIFTTYLSTAPLMYSISKIGCFFAGCCLGIPYDGMFCVKYNNWRTKAIAFPIQLVETIVFAIIFVICHILYKKGHKKYINEIILLTSAFFKFLLDFLRESHAEGFVITVNQIVSIAFCIGAGVSIYLKRRKRLA